MCVHRQCISWIFVGSNLITALVLKYFDVIGPYNFKQNNEECQQLSGSNPVFMPLSSLLSSFNTLLLSYTLATSMVISGWITTYDSVPSWQLYSAAHWEMRLLSQ